MGFMSYDRIYKQTEITTIYIFFNKYVKLGGLNYFIFFYSQLIVKRGTASHP